MQAVTNKNGLRLGSAVIQQFHCRRRCRSNDTVAAFVFTLYGANRAFLTSQRRNLTIGQIMVLPKNAPWSLKTNVTQMYGIGRFLGHHQVGDRAIINRSYYYLAYCTPDTLL